MMSLHIPYLSCRGLFEDFAEVAERSGVYTAEDYIGIMEHLIDR